MDWRYIKTGIFLLAVLFFIVGLGAVTGAYELLVHTNISYFLLAVLLYLASVFVWIFSWMYVMKLESPQVSNKGLLGIGFGSVCGAITPLQIGSDAMRVLFAKKLFNIDSKKTLGACLFAKGLKFGVLAAFSILVLVWLLFTTKLSIFAIMSLVFGFLVIILAVLFFLGPAERSVGNKLARFFHFLSRKIKKLAWLRDFFNDYSLAFSKITSLDFFFVFVLTLISWFAEFFAIVLSFMSVGIELPLLSFFVLVIVIGILEKVPIVPRGIGLVEFAGYILLASPILVGTSIGISQIGAALVVFDIVRLFIPSAISFFYAIFFMEKLGKKGI
ncbi:MAG: flippase-like domain-containing protein [Candidatus Diapherotrites archaeon]|nr:flippase-like domain-containing protein [Candidatus Diapherotrites archaeon]